MLLTILFLVNISNTSRKKKKYILHPTHADQIEEVLANILYWMLRLYSIIKQSSRKTQKHHFLRPQCYTLCSCVNTQATAVLQLRTSRAAPARNVQQLAYRFLNLHFTDVLIINSFFPCHVHAWTFSSWLVGKQKGSTYSTNSSNLSQTLSPILFLILVHQESSFLEIMRGLFFLRFLCVTVARDGS